MFRPYRDVRFGKVKPNRGAHVISHRLRKRIGQDFPTTTDAAERLVVEAGNADHGQAVERIQAAVVLSARGNWDYLSVARDLAISDFRDLLTNAGLEQNDWPARLDAELGS